jgi:hypothetical protein
MRKEALDRNNLLRSILKNILVKDQDTPSSFGRINTFDSKDSMQIQKKWDTNGTESN